MNDNSTGDINPSAAADAQAEATSEKTISTQAQNDTLKNLKGEFNRKISKMEQKLDAVLNRFTTQNPAPQLSEEEANVEPDVKKYVDTVVTKQHQKTALDEAYHLFPELNPESESFDEKFYQAVDMEFSRNQSRDPKGPLKAAKLIALELGKIEALTKANILKDDARRSRVLSEGISTPRDAKKAQDPSVNFNLKGLARLGINPEKLAKRLKDNKEKYEG
jgi:hypothetical protein